MSRLNRLMEKITQLMEPSIFGKPLVFDIKTNVRGAAKTFLNKSEEHTIYVHIPRTPHEKYVIVRCIGTYHINDFGEIITAIRKEKPEITYVTRQSLKAIYSVNQIDKVIV